jgi:hypothetical protein
MSDYLAERDLGDGRKAWVVPLTFGRARIIVGPAESQFIDDSW